MQNHSRNSELGLRGPKKDLKSHPRRSRLGGSAPFSVLSPMATTKRAAGRAGGCLLYTSPSPRD
eukprot:1313669-Alexandrium_andersonii.AAC.1